MKKRIIATLVIASLLAAGTLLYLHFNKPSDTGTPTPPKTCTTYDGQAEGQCIENRTNLTQKETPKRAQWQEKASALAEKLEEVLPATDYGGIWINKTTDRINVGSVEGSISSAATKRTIMRESRAAGVSDGVDIVTVKYPYSVLMQNAKAISDLQKEYIDVKNEWALQVGLAVEKNKIQIDTPKDESHMSDGHREFLSIINKRYGNQVIYSTYTKPPVPQRNE